MFGVSSVVTMTIDFESGIEIVKIHTINALPTKSFNFRDRTTQSRFTSFIFILHIQGEFPRQTQNTPKWSVPGYLRVCVWERASGMVQFIWGHSQDIYGVIVCVHNFYSFVGSIFSTMSFYCMLSETLLQS